jgi:hypothetical protein
LQEVTSRDGIHFSNDGYKNMTSRVLNCIESMFENPKKEKKEKTYFWRGFRSPIGAQSWKALAGRPAAARGAQRGGARGGRVVSQHLVFHPYKRW